MIVHVMRHDGENIVIFSESDQTARSTAVLDEIVGDILANPADERNDRFPMLAQLERPITPDAVITNIPLFAELIYGPAEGTGGGGFPDDDDKRALRRGYREDADGITLESEGDGQ